VKYLSVPMVALYAATKAMYEALKILKETEDIKALEAMGVTWAEFNDIVGFKRWRQLELELLTPEELYSMYGTLDLNEIIQREFEETVAKWQRKQ
ncbi:MAG: hypothetical protein QXH94_07190, partial [Sulfolobales archaeon]